MAPRGQAPRPAQLQVVAGGGEVLQLEVDPAQPVAVLAQLVQRLPARGAAPPPAGGRLEVARQERSEPAPRATPGGRGSARTPPGRRPRPRRRRRSPPAPPGGRPELGGDGSGHAGGRRQLGVVAAPPPSPGCGRRCRPAGPAPARTPGPGPAPRTDRSARPPPPAAPPGCGRRPAAGPARARGSRAPAPSRTDPGPLQLTRLLGRLRQRQVHAGLGGVGQRQAPSRAAKAWLRASLSERSHPPAPRPPPGWPGPPSRSSSSSWAARSAGTSGRAQRRSSQPSSACGSGAEARSTCRSASASAIWSRFSASRARRVNVSVSSAAASARRKRGIGAGLGVGTTALQTPARPLGQPCCPALVAGLASLQEERVRLVLGAAGQQQGAQRLQRLR